MAPKAVRGPVARMTTVAVPLDHRCAHEDEVRRVRAFGLRAIAGMRALLRGQGLAGEGRLLDVEIASFEHAPVTGYEVPR